MIKNIFDQNVADEVIGRINGLTHSSQALWGKMNVAQMLAHCNATYAYTFEQEKFQRPGPIKKFLIRSLVKPYVVGTKPYRTNGHTAPYFVVTDERNFERERNLLIENIRRCQNLGESFFEGKENLSFGRMNASEWNNLYYKHLDHHLRQFGV